MNTNRRETFTARLKSDGRVREAFAAAKTAQGEFVDELTPILKFLYPEQEIGTLKVLLKKESDPEVISAAMKRIDELGGDGAKHAQARARVISKKLSAVFAGKVEDLLKAADAAAEALAADTVQAEREFFGSFGVPHEPTEVSNRVAVLKTSLRSLRAQAGPSALLLALGQRRVRLGEFDHVIRFFQ